MKVDIFTEGSSTLKDNPETGAVRDYFGGGFLSVTSLADELSDRGADAQIHVLSEELGYITGDDEVPDNADEELGMEEFVNAKNDFREQMRDSAANSDIIVLLFTKDSFRTLVSTQWEQLVEEASPGSIWCISTSGKAFDTVDLDALREKDVDLVQYERVGVARIGNEAKDKLYERIDG